MPPNPILIRRRYIIKRGLQFRYIGLIFALAVLASLVTGWAVFATMWSFLGEKLANVYPQGRLIYVLRATNLALIRNLLLVSPLVFILGLLFSHRIAGPLYRIEKTIDEIAKGNLTIRIKLRQGDELSDLADEINRMAENLDKVLSSDKKTMLEIQRDLDELKRIVSSQPCDCTKLSSLINAIQAKTADAISFPL